MICGECDTEMDKIKENGYDAVSTTPDSQPDFIITSVEWRCPECGEYVLEDLEYYAE